jgi:hypothetical protein
MDAGPQDSKQLVLRVSITARDALGETRVSRIIARGQTQGWMHEELRNSAW